MIFSLHFWRCWNIVWCCCFAFQTASAQTLDRDALAAEAVTRLQEYIRVQTINPPGNEILGVQFFADLLEAEGIPFETVESAPGRGNIWARLEGGSEPALLLLHHMDVVPADAAYWEVDPYEGIIRDGYVYGRGALDTKGLGIFHFLAFLALKRMDKPLNRDVIFMATADEEAGGFFGAGWLARERPELFADVGWLLNEGGSGSVINGREVYRVECTQKVPLWLRLIATGTPGHGSSPRVESAVTRLIRALNNIRTHRYQPRIVPAVDAYFKGLAEFQKGERRTQYQDIAAALHNDTDAQLALQLHSPGMSALTRNTISITRLSGSSKINVVPPEVSAELDCRLLPDQDPDVFIAELLQIINDPAIRIEKIMGFSPAVSTTDTDLFRAIETITRRHFPGVPVIPSVSTGFTDSHFFRDMGIVCYGFNPSLIQPEDGSGVHGNNERISLVNIRRSVLMQLEILESVVY